MLDVAHQRHKKMQESHCVSTVSYASHDAFGCIDGAASPTSSDERSDPATGDSFMTITGTSFLSLRKGLKSSHLLPIADRVIRRA